jgi:4-amino-4-deoxy-L-arabinose transferase-like glycosyltransferase
MAGASARVFLVVTGLLGAVVTWFRPGPRLLVGGDSGIYARIARELAERPISTWVELSLDGAAFSEHPPLALWVEALAFRVLGASVPVAVGVARAWATLALVLLAVAAFRLHGGDADARRRAAGFTVLGALCLPGFLYVSQVAMLETPLLAWLALGLVAVAGRGRGDVALFALALVGGFWTKGPPALVLLGLLGGLGGVKLLPWRRAAGLAVTSLGALVLSVVLFDAARGALGLKPFFGTYFAHQVFPSIAEGRHNPDRNPFFYVGPMLNWYTPAVLAVVALSVPWVRARVSRPVAVTGGLLVAGVLVGFSAVPQKYQWYLHACAGGAALLVGAVLHAVGERLERHLSPAVAVCAVAWPLISFAPWPLTFSEQQVLAVQASAAPPPGARVVDCSGQEAWAAEHLQGFVWRTRRVACGGEGEWRWDGTELRAVSAVEAQRE